MKEGLSSVYCIVNLSNKMRSVALIAIVAVVPIVVTFPDFRRPWCFFSSSSSSSSSSFPSLFDERRSDPTTTFLPLIRI